MAVKKHSKAARKAKKLHAGKGLKKTQTLIKASFDRA
jgi:hypothetical protein